MQVPAGHGQSFAFDKLRAIVLLTPIHRTVNTRSVQIIRTQDDGDNFLVVTRSSDRGTRVVMTAIHSCRFEASLHSVVQPAALNAISVPEGSIAMRLPCGFCHSAWRVSVVSCSAT